MDEKLKALIEEAKFVTEKIFNNSEAWDIDINYGTPYVKVFLHSIIHNLLIELSELKIDEQPTSKPTEEIKN